jgi:hypothetical protein
MPEPTNPAAKSAAARVAGIQKLTHDFQVNQAKSVAPYAATAVAMAALRARQESTARSNEMLAQQRQMNHQMWIQNQLLSGRSMQDIEAQMASERAEQLAQQRAKAAKNKADSAGMGRFLICAALGVFLAVEFSWVAPWPRALLWAGVPIVLLIWWDKIRPITTPAATKPTTANESSPAASQSTHEQWVDDFQAKHGRKLEADPPPD